MHSVRFTAAPIRHLFRLVMPMTHQNERTIHPILFATDSTRLRVGRVHRTIDLVLRTIDLVLRASGLITRTTHLVTRMTRSASRTTRLIHFTSQLVRTMAHPVHSGFRRIRLVSHHMRRTGGSMQNSQRAILGTLEGAQEFLDQNAEGLGGVAANGTRKKLGRIVSALTSHHTTQTQSVVSAQQLTLSTSAARRALLQDHLASIAAVAKAELPNVPELALARRTPKGSAPVGTLLTRAESVAKAVAPFADTFVAAGMPADFLAQLQGATDAVAHVASSRKASLDKASGATVGIAKQLAAGRRQINILDKQVRTALRGADPALLKEWKERTRLPKKTAQAAAPPATSASAAPAATSATTPTPAPTPVAAAA